MGQSKRNYPVREMGGAIMPDAADTEFLRKEQKDEKNTVRDGRVNDGWNGLRRL